MRIEDPLIVGAGPAGCAAAIALARGGITPLLVDRDEQVGDPLCGGFLSWRTAEQLAELGIAPAALGAHRVTRLRLFDGTREAGLDLPHAAWGLSRHALDIEMRAEALQQGARIAFDTVREIAPGRVVAKAQEWKPDTILLASGKHDIRGRSRPRHRKDTALGLRLRLPASPERTALLKSAIELHLFPGGYAGIVLQEGESANICLALRKSALADADSSPETLFAQVAARSPAFAARLGEDWRGGRFDTIGAVPYGYIAASTEDGIYRLGDQAAVIPSLAGEGISIAIASGVAAATAMREGQSAPDFQRAFAARARMPIRLASAAWHMGETRLGARAAIALANIAPSLVADFADRARIAAPASLAHA
ncbi:MAG: FAD-dependent monooxygenase [Alteraurantiacibacter sp.]